MTEYVTKEECHDYARKQTAEVLALKSLEPPHNIRAVYLRRADNTFITLKIERVITAGDAFEIVVQ